MTEEQPSKLKAWAQIQLGKALFKVYQLKTAWASRFGRKPASDGIQEGGSTTSIE
jgi:hypothetical protein